MPYDVNPFPPADADRHAIWEMLVRRDIEAYLTADWDAHARDFVPDGFFGIDGLRSSNPDSWRPLYPSLDAYARNWIAFARQSIGVEYAEDHRLATYRATILRDIDIQGDFAVAHKKFDGSIARADGGMDRLNWQTIYLCRKLGQTWKIAGFLGYLPNPMGTADGPTRSVIRAPASSQHVTAGPYSPVLEVAAGRLVVISGQVAVGPDGTMLAADFAGQARATLSNCAAQLAAAGCTLADVFKVNCYVTDLDHWPQFNAVYLDIMPKPLPVRTTVQTGLLGDYLVEIEMWAAKP
ncbi:MAG: RidA family protein [Devosia sp.]|nr:RidA family protein [Devosia sp.]